MFKSWTLTTGHWQGYRRDYKQNHPNKWPEHAYKMENLGGTTVYQGTTGNISEANRLSILPPIIKFFRCDILLHCEMEWCGLHRQPENRVSHLQMSHSSDIDVPEIYSKSKSGSSGESHTEWPIFHKNGDCMSAHQNFESLQSHLLTTTWDAHYKYIKLSY